MQNEIDQARKQVRIVIGQRGWVHIGVYAASKDEVILTRAKCIRRWGTTRGLGQLRTGPLPETVLDDVGTYRVHPLAVVGTYDCDASAWEAALGA